MPYYFLFCGNENTYRWHTVTDIKKDNNPILQSIIKEVKEDIVVKAKNINKEIDIEKYDPHLLGIQIITCPSCNERYIDVIINNQIKVRENLWKSYESNRFINQILKDKNVRK